MVGVIKIETYSLWVVQIKLDTLKMFQFRPYTNLQCFRLRKMFKQNGAMWFLQHVCLLYMDIISFQAAHHHFVQAFSINNITHNGFMV